MERVLVRVKVFYFLGEPRNIGAVGSLRQIGRFKRFVAIELAALAALDFKAIRRERRLPRIKQLTNAVAMIEGMGMLCFHPPESHVWQPYANPFTPPLPRPPLVPGGASGPQIHRPV